MIDNGEQAKKHATNAGLCWRQSGPSEASLQNIDMNYMKMEVYAKRQERSCEG